jgi:hypothetical protein
MDGVAVNPEDIEFIILRLQLAKSPQQGVRIFLRERGESQPSAWGCRREGSCPAFRVKRGIMESEFLEVGEITEELDERVQSEADTIEG